MRGLVTFLVSCGEDTHKKFSHHPTLDQGPHGEVLAWQGAWHISVFDIQSQVHGTYTNNYTLISPTVVLGPTGTSVGYTLNHFAGGLLRGDYLGSFKRLGPRLHGNLCNCMAVKP